MPRNHILKGEEISLNVDRCQVFVRKKKIDLTATECNLLAYLLQNPNVVLSRKQFLNRVWGDGYRGTTRTVDTHMQRLRQKLGRSGQRIHTVRGEGYWLEA